MRLTSQIVFGLLLFACMRSTYSQKGRLSNCETFFVGEGVTQYFINPFLKGSATNESIIMDVTYRSNYTDTSKVICNFSLTASSVCNDFSFIAFEPLGTASNYIYPLKKMHEDHRSSKHLYRYSFLMPAIHFKSTFSKNIRQIILSSQLVDQKMLIAVSAKRNKEIQLIYSRLIAYTLKDIHAE